MTLRNCTYIDSTHVHTYSHLKAIRTLTTTTSLSDRLPFYCCISSVTRTSIRVDENKRRSKYTHLCTSKYLRTRTYICMSVFFVK